MCEMGGRFFFKKFLAVSTCWVNVGDGWVVALVDNCSMAYSWASHEGGGAHVGGLSTLKFWEGTEICKVNGWSRLCSF